MNGEERIIAERHRQIAEEGFDPAGDVGRADEIIDAAICYLDASLKDIRALARGSHRFEQNPYSAPFRWPWAGRFWKPTPTDPSRQLEKAGALIMAAIDANEAARAQPPETS